MELDRVPARAGLRRSSGTRPTHVGHYYRARIELLGGDTAAAIDALHAALRVRPEHEASRALLDRLLSAGAGTDRDR